MTMVPPIADSSRLHVILCEPEIPGNTGAIGRTCVALGAKLWLVRPLGFQLTDRHIKRAGLDYWPFLDWRIVDALDEVVALLGRDRLWSFSTKAEGVYTEASFALGDGLVFGPESRGLAESWLRARPDRAVRIPIRPEARSLNLSTLRGHRPRRGGPPRRGRRTGRAAAPGVRRPDNTRSSSEAVVGYNHRGRRRASARGRPTRSRRENRRMHSRRTIAAWLWTLLIFVLCWTPRALVPEGEGPRTMFLIPHFDKVVHFTLFVGFAYLWLAAGTIRAWWVVVLGIAAAVVSELGQANSIVRRDANWPDGFADTAGVAVGLLAYYATRRRRLTADPVTTPSAGTP